MQNDRRVCINTREKLMHHKREVGHETVYSMLGSHEGRRLQVREIASCVFQVFEKMAINHFYFSLVCGGCRPCPARGSGGVAIED